MADLKAVVRARQPWGGDGSESPFFTGWRQRVVLPELEAFLDGQRTLLINTRFPLYRESKGDVWYVVETGVFELTRRIRAGELTVDEYYDEVNRILQHAADAAHEGDAAVPLEAVAS